MHLQVEFWKETHRYTHTMTLCEYGDILLSTVVLIKTSESYDTYINEY